MQVPAIRAVLSFLAAIGLFAAQNATAIPLSFVSRAGDTAPGTTEAFTLVRSAAINDLGEVAFLGTLTGTNRYGVWQFDPANGVELIARQGQQAPDMPPGDTWNSLFGDPVITAQGQLILYASVITTGGSEVGIWVEDGSGAFELTALRGAQAPGTPAGTHFVYIDPNFKANDAAEVAFGGSLGGPDVDPFGTNDQGAWTSAGGGGLVLIGREGEPRPGGPPGGNWGGTPRPRISDTGQVYVATAGVRRRELDGTLTHIAELGDPAPGIPGAVLRGPTEPVLAGSHAVVQLFLEVGVGGVTDDDDVGIWEIAPDGSLELRVLEGDPGWDAIPGIDIEAFSQIVPNDAGDMVLKTRLKVGPGGVELSNNTVLWKIDSAGTFLPLARTGDPVPDLVGVTFSGFNDVVTNDVGDVVFVAGLNGPGAVIGEGVFHVDPTGEIRTVLREDDLVDPGTGPAVVFDIAYLNEHTGGLRNRQALNDLAQLAMVVSYTDVATPEGRSAIVVADLAATACGDESDNDGDGLIDELDPGCVDAADLDERDPLLPCDDGADNDEDGRVDFDPLTLADPTQGLGDPGCADPLDTNEDPACQDGANNDSDLVIDFDGGQSIYGACSPGPGGCPLGVSDPNDDGIADADPTCAGRPWWRNEGQASGCGLGPVLATLLPLLWVARCRSSRRTPQA